MRIRTFAIFLGVLLATIGSRAMPAFACMGSTVLLQDDFTILQANWGQPNAVVSVQNGALVIKPALNSESDVLNNGNVFTDMDACVTVEPTTIGPQEGRAYAALIFWATDLNNYYDLAVSGLGTFAIYRHVADRWITVMPWTPNAAIKKGVNQSNQLRVVTKGTQATVYINGTQLTTFSGQPPAGGGEIGLAGAAGTKTLPVWQFTALKITNAS
ncbi:MAG: hypothetical protein WAM05_07440 [Candidatus Binataceae bacterium]